MINDFNSSILNDNNEKIIQDSINYITFLFEYSENSFKMKKYVLNEFYNIMNVIYNKFNEVTKEGVDLINKFLKCDYILKNEKRKIIIYFNALIDRNKYSMLKEII